MTKLTIFSHKIFRSTLQGMQTTGALTIQIDALAPYFEQIVVCAPVIDDPSFQGVGITQRNISFHPLPYYSNKLDFVRLIWKIQKEIRAVIEHTDLALVILSGYVGILASALCQRHHKPIFQWIVGDWGEIVRVNRGNPITRLLADVTISPLLNRLLARLTRDTLTFFNGHILYDQKRSYHYTRTSSSISERTFHRTKDLSLPHSPCRVLFVGRLSPEKGLRYLFDAAAFLKKVGQPIEVHIIGTGASKRELVQRVRELGISQQVHWHGFVPQGETLRRFYRESDIFVLPSLQDQQPKVLLEAMSQSLPVIATEVGGVPSIIREGENGLLVPPANFQAIAAAINRLTVDLELRQELINSGLTYANDHTVEQETAKMMQIVTAHFKYQESSI